VKKFDSRTDKEVVYSEIAQSLRDDEYTIVEANETKPWGAYYRLSGDQADRFIAQYFPGLSGSEARMGVADRELSPKILIVNPGQRLSWQYHGRRAERWTFLTDGMYVRSDTDVENPPHAAKAGDVVQFACGERHRLVGVDDGYTIVAEIWQHVDPSHPSDEDDIVRVQDDYKR
jgi:mannose-6-phosphate isomerase